MDTASQQRILGYFIEEAKEHLQTLEQGILQLSSVVNDAEMVNEMFRAAHSVKGGAAMLGYTSIQKIAHRLEDSFKTLKENTVPVDQKLESLFLTGYDFLHDLIDRLERSTDFCDDDAVEIMDKVESNFALLQNYLNELMNGGSSPQLDTQKPASQKVTISANFPEEVKNVLRQMLQIFKQKATLENRQELDRLCLDLARLAPGEQRWQDLIQQARSAISNAQHAYSILAPIVIKDLKLGSDYLQAGQIAQISSSKNLRDLSATAAASQIIITTEPNAAAKELMRVFNKEQLSILIKILSANL